MNSRRSFLKNTALCGSLLSLPTLLAAPAAKAAACNAIPLKKGAVILFQGDSITDAGRDKGKHANTANHIRALGTGYVFHAPATLLEKYPDRDLKIFNRGISGHKIPDLKSRWERDTIALKPDVLSILIGVNDYCHTLKANNPYKGTTKDYEEGFREILKTTKEKLPNTKIILCEPFAVAEGRAISKDWVPAFDKYREIAKKISKEFGTLYIPFHTLLNNAAKKAPKQYYSEDGVHPTLAGAKFMANRWVETVQ